MLTDYRLVKWRPEDRTALSPKAGAALSRKLAAEFGFQVVEDVGTPEPVQDNNANQQRENCRVLSNRRETR